MTSFRPDLLYLILLLVVPGLLSQGVFKKMVARGQGKQVDIYDISYSILHSIAIYMIVYTLMVLILGVEMINTESLKVLIGGKRWSPLIAVGVMCIVSILWGYVYSKFYRSNILESIVCRFGTAVEPPNIYAAILVDQFKDKVSVNSTYWITVREADYFIEGCVEMVSVTKEPREIYLTKVVYLDKQRNVIHRLSKNTGVIIRVDDFSVLEITSIKQ